MNRADAKLMLLEVLLSIELISPSEKSAATATDADDIQFGALGIDSLAVVDLCAGVEERMGRELRVEEIIDHPTVNLLAAHLAEAT